MGLGLRRHVVRGLYIDSPTTGLMGIYAKRGELQQGNQTRVVTIGVFKQSDSLVPLDV